MDAPPALPPRVRGRRRGALTLSVRRIAWLEAKEAEEEDEADEEARTTARVRARVRDAHTGWRGATAEG